jgi:hypothetical protein
MESFAPEFAHYWLHGQLKGAGDVKAERSNDETSAQQAALEELAERVTAARSVI